MGEIDSKPAALVAPEIELPPPQSVEVDLSPPPGPEAPPVAPKNPVQEQDNISPDHPRFKDVYRKMKTAEKQLADRDAVIARQEQQINQVMTKMTQWEQQNLRSQLDNLTYQKAQANAEGDWQKAAQLETQYNQMILNQQQQQGQQNPYQNQQNYQQPQQYQQQYQQPSQQQYGASNVDAQSEIIKSGWMLENNWYNTDPTLKTLADNIADELMIDPVWSDKPLRTVLNEVSNRARSIRPDKFHQPAPQTPPSLGMDNNPPLPPNKNKVTLDADEMKVAEFMFPDKSRQEAYRTYAESKLGGIR